MKREVATCFDSLYPDYDAGSSISRKWVLMKFEEGFRLVTGNSRLEFEGDFPKHENCGDL